jgi:hypothetical protein
VIEENQEVFGPDVLGFVARTRPNSPLLVQLAFRILSDGQIPLGSPWRLAAAEVLGECFAGNDEVLQQLLAVQPGPREDPVLMIGVAEGWPDCSVLDELWTDYGQYGWAWGPVSQAHLLCLKGNCQQVVDFTQHCLSWSLPPHDNPIPHIARPVVRRLRKDTQLAEIFLDRLREIPTATEKAVLPSLLASAGRLTPEFRNWCSAEVNRQHDTDRVAEFGLDPATAELKPVAHLLLGILTNLRG